LLTEQYPASAESVPDVVMVELSRETEAALAFASHLHRLRPSACIMACSTSRQPSPDLLMQAMRSGICEFLSQPIDPIELHSALERLVRERGLTGSGAEKLIAVIGAKGGVGTTTVAVNVGVQMAQITRKKVALLDFGRPLGHASLMLDLQPRFSIRDAMQDVDRLDSHLFGGLLTAHQSGLQVLAGTSHSDEWDLISSSAVARVINVAQSNCDFVLADFGPVYSSDWASVFSAARLVVLIAESNVPSLWSLEQHLSTMASFGVNPERFRVVINRWHRADEEAVKAVEKKIKCPVFAHIPNGYRQVNEAVNLGTPLSGKQDNPLMLQFRNLAAQFAGLPVEVEEKRASVFSLFSPSKLTFPQRIAKPLTS
jgi:pilus assembly protein CpaE